MSEFYAEWPKAELHLHLEGSVEPETVLEIDPALDIAEVRSKYHHTDFPGFIRSYVWVNRQLRTPDHYRLITRRLLERLHQQNIVLAEINLSAGVILWKEQDLYGIFEAITEEANASPVRVGWIFDAVRQFGVEPARRVAELAVELRDQGVIGFGIGGDEVAGPAGWFQNVFDYARDGGLAIIPHAGETDGPDSVWACVNMGADRIGHGIRAADDPELMRHLSEKQIPLEVCISSNVRTGSVGSLDQHPVRRLFDAGVPITLNTDDPALFETTLLNEYRIARDHFGFTEAELQQINENAFRFSRSGERNARPGAVPVPEALQQDA